jgi:hypothetical protein
MTLTEIGKIIFIVGKLLLIIFLLGGAIYYAEWKGDYAHAAFDVILVILLDQK